MNLNMRIAVVHPFHFNLTVGSVRIEWIPVPPAPVLDADIPDGTLSYPFDNKNDGSTETAYIVRFPYNRGMYPCKACSCFSKYWACLSSVDEITYEGPAEILTVRNGECQWQLFDAEVDVLPEEAVEGGY